MNASSWAAAYARRKSFGGYQKRYQPAPDEVDDRQVDLIEAAHRDIDQWVAEGAITSAQAARLRDGLPPRLVLA